MQTIFDLRRLPRSRSASGCTSDDYRAGNGLTDGVGNAMYANTVMQMVDPWQRRVQNTNLRVPAVRGSQPGAADEAAADKETQSTGTDS